jgi:hypothetical protein
MSVKLLSPEQVSRIPEMRDRGMTWWAIAETFGVSVGTVRNQCFKKFPELRPTHQTRRYFGNPDAADVVPARDLEVLKRHFPAPTIGELTAQPSFFDEKITMRRLMAGR